MCGDDEEDLRQRRQRRRAARTLPCILMRCLCKREKSGDHLLREGTRRAESLTTSSTRKWTRIVRKLFENGNKRQGVAQPFPGAGAVTRLTSLTGEEERVSKP